MSSLRLIWGLRTQVISVDRRHEPGVVWVYVYLVDHGKKKWLRITESEALDSDVDAGKLVDHA